MLEENDCCSVEARLRAPGDRRWRQTRTGCGGRGCPARRTDAPIAYRPSRPASRLVMFHDSQTMAGVIASSRKDHQISRCPGARSLVRHPSSSGPFIDLHPGTMRLASFDLAKST
jgi:hypothetical protein